MGALDDAIREHLELKRRHGASDDEIKQAEAEALGPARRGVVADPGFEVDEAGMPAPADGVDAPAVDAAGAPPPPAPDSAVHDAPPPPPGLGEDSLEEPPAPAPVVGSYEPPEHEAPLAEPMEPLDPVVPPAEPHAAAV